MITVTPVAGSLPRFLAIDAIMQSRQAIQELCTATTDNSVIIYAQIANGSLYPEIGWRYFEQSHANQFARTNSVWMLGRISSADAVVEWPMGVDYKALNSGTPWSVLVHVLGFDPTLVKVSFE